MDVGFQSPDMVRKTIYDDLNTCASSMVYEHNSAVTLKYLSR